MCILPSSSECEGKEFVETDEQFKVKSLVLATPPLPHPLASIKCTKKHFNGKGKANL